MKARIKATGEIINTAPYARIALDKCDSRGNPIELRPDEIELIQDKKDDFNWQTFRAEATKDILCAVLNGGISSGLNGIVLEKETIVRGAIEVADELIKQLKKNSHA